MKTIRQSVIIFAVTSLPFLLTAQTSGGSSSSSSSGSRTTTQPSSITSQSGSASGTIDRENSLPVQTTGSSSPSSSGQLSNQPGTFTGRPINSNSANTGANSPIERIDKDTLDAQLTAKDLIDKEVYDRNEKKIGKIVDVVLTGQTGPLAYAFADNVRHDSTSGSTNQSRMNAGAGPSTASSSSGRPLSDNANGRVSSTGKATNQRDESSSQPAVIIAHGGTLGMGKDLFRAPVAQLNYDSNLQHLKLNLTENDISAMTSADTSANR